MKTIALAVLSIFVLIVLGFVLRQRIYRNRHFWDMLDSLTYFILVPSMLFYQIAVADISAADELLRGFMVVFAVLLILLMFLVVYNHFHPFPAAAFTSIAQGSIRFNSYIFLAIIGSVYHQSGLLVAAFIMALMIPLINVIVVAVFAVFVRDGRFSWYQTFKHMMKNPLIWACLLGFFVNFLGIEKSYLDSFKMLGNAAITTGLLSIGAGLRLPHFRALKTDFYLSGYLKLLAYPALVFTLCQAWHLNETITAICTIYAALPTATSSYIMAKHMGGDKELMSLIITLQTLISPLTMWLILSLFHLAA